MAEVASISQQIWDMKYRLKTLDGQPVDKAGWKQPDPWTPIIRAGTLVSLPALLSAPLVFLALLSSMLFVVDQRQFGVVYALGQIKEVITEPGLNFKLPPPFQNVVFLDRRIQTLDSPENRPIFTAEKKSLVIDWLIDTLLAQSLVGNAGAQRCGDARMPREQIVDRQIHCNVVRV